jgi:hypothetical protein
MNTNVMWLKSVYNRYLHQDCAGCTAFKKLTNEFEKALLVIDAFSIGHVTYR